MKRVLVDRAGSYGQLALRDVPMPTPGPGEVLVAVDAIGVNFADCLVRQGLYASAKTYVGWPITPGFEVAGQVAALGAGVQGFAVGDDVMALTRFGGYTEALVVPAAQVFHRPEALGAAEAAAFQVVNLTAWYALELGAVVGPGQRVLVHSAAGGVGLALVQLALARGAEVVGVVGASHKVAVAEQAGAAVVDKSALSRDALWRELRARAPQGYDAVFDANGVETLGQSYEHLRAGGRLVVYGFHTMLPRAGTGRLPGLAKLLWGWLRTPRFSPLDMTTRNRSVLAFNLSFMFDRTDILTRAMSALTAHLEYGHLAPPLVTTYPFAEVGAAHRALESGATVGKLVLLV